MSASPVETAILRAAPYLFGGVGAALPLLLVPTDSSRLVVVTTHLSILVAMALVAALRLAPLV